MCHGEYTMLKRIVKSKFWPALGEFLYILCVWAGLPLLGWGLDSLPLFFANPVRGAFISLVFVQAFISAWMLFITPPHPTHEHRFDLARWNLYLFETIFVLAAFGDRRNILAWDENMLLRWAGLGIYILGALLVAWAEWSWTAYLRKGTQPVYDNPLLISNGPFKWIRYPGYLGLIFYCLGCALMLRSWAGVALMAPLIWGINNRIENAEKVFGGQYGNRWAERWAASKRLIPFVY
jgi:protein-S-isoprenylcysteine O-methyltransferase Ste14